MNNSGAICNVNSTYLGHPCLYDKSSKYAFPQSEQKLLRRYFKGHLSVIWKSCQSPSRRGAAEMAQKIIFTLSLSLSTSLFQIAATTFAIEWQVIYTGKWIVFKLRKGWVVLWAALFSAAVRQYQICYHKCDLGRAECHYVWYWER